MIYTKELTLQVQSLFGLCASDYSVECIEEKLNDEIYKYKQLILHSEEEGDILHYIKKLENVEGINATLKTLKK